jgi:hypothetical protein
MPGIIHAPLYQIRPAFAFFTCASFANKQNCTAKGWAFGASVYAWSPGFLLVFIKKSTPTYAIFF